MSHEKFKSCIDACYACAAMCDHCANACLQEDDVKMMAKCIAMDIECARICRMAAASMASGSPFTKAVCQLCADVCQACGDECAKHQMGHCQECAQACHRCAAECRNMVAMA